MSMRGERKVSRTGAFKNILSAIALVFLFPLLFLRLSELFLKLFALGHVPIIGIHGCVFKFLDLGAALILCLDLGFLCPPHCRDNS